ncbi:MAG: hypothetical protein LBS01_01420 [Prevotellaceae bacterium]|jgi:hypothetical protein|nr:hypothetical protein [Prevotellaceae bacterium]
MAKYTKEEYTLARKQKQALLKLMLNKTGTKHKDLIDLAEQQFIRANLDVVTPAEKRQFNRLVFSAV